MQDILVGFTTSTFTTSRVSELGGFLVDKPYVRPQKEEAQYLQLTFYNLSGQVVEQFYSEQRDIQKAKLKYNKIGGLVSMDVQINVNIDDSYYGDMVVGASLDVIQLGRVVSDKIEVVDGILSIEGTSVFRRFSNYSLPQGGLSNSTISAAVLYVLDALMVTLMKEGEQSFFDINEDKIIIDESIILSRIEWKEDDALKILSGIAMLTGKASYGIDNEGDFYFHDQTLIPAVRVFEDVDAVDIDLSERNDAIVNSLNLSSKRQDQNTIIPIGTFDDESSQARYGKRVKDVVIPFFYGQGEQSTFAHKMLTLAPAVSGSFRHLSEDSNVSTGRYAITQNLSSAKRIMVNPFKNDSDFVVGEGMTVARVHENQVTSRYMYSFITASEPSTIMIHRSRTSDIEFVDTLLILMKSSTSITIDAMWSEYEQPKAFSFDVIPVMTYHRIPVSTIDGYLTLSLPSEATVYIDSIYAIVSSVETREAFYESHTIDIIGDDVEVNIEVGGNPNDLIDQLKGLQDKAIVANDLLTQNR
jgi:hypothetical protein